VGKSQKKALERGAGEMVRGGIKGGKGGAYSEKPFREKFCAFIKNCRRKHRTSEKGKIYSGGGCGHGVIAGLKKSRETLGKGESPKKKKWTKKNE